MIQKFISKLSEKEKKIVYVAVGVVLLAIMDRLFLGPVTAKLKVLDDDIRTQENSIKRDLRFLAYKDRIIKEERMLNKYYVKKPQSEEEIIAGFLKRIEILASEAKINLVKVTPTESEQKKGYIEYFASLECTGKLKDVVSFMYSVDAAPELLKIIKLTMNAKKASPDEVISSMTVSKILVEGGAEGDGNPVSDPTAADAMHSSSPENAGSDLAADGNLAVPVVGLPTGAPAGAQISTQKQGP